MNLNRSAGLVAAGWEMVRHADDFEILCRSQASVFATVDGYVRRRLRSVLPWRLDGVGKGIGATHPRWPNEWIARCGLLTLTAEHEWTRTILVLRTH